MRAVPAGPTIRHATIVCERRYPASRRDVFKAWADPDAYRIWHVPGEGWEVVESVRDFRVGGRDFSRFGPAGSPRHHSEGRFQIIAPDRYIVSAGTMFCDGMATSSTLCSIEILDVSGGGQVIVTDQSAYVDPEAAEDERRLGWEQILAKLGLFLTPGEDRGRM